MSFEYSAVSAVPFRPVLEVVTAADVGLDLESLAAPAQVADRRAVHAPRRGAAGADGGVHRFVRVAELRHVERHAVPESLDARFAAHYRGSRWAVVHRRAGDAHGPHSVAARRPPGSYAGRGG